jgi:hypothetical protein
MARAPYKSVYTDRTTTGNPDAYIQSHENNGQLGHGASGLGGGNQGNARTPSPEQAKALTVPLDNGGRLD